LKFITIIRAMEKIMGNFSRNSFRETNILNNLLGLVVTPVTEAKHYVGVRLQQGVPVLDADWNELEDIRRMELVAMLRYFIGNGVPAGNQGFQILATGGANNFAIGGGIILVDGLLVINGALTTYQTQSNAAGLPALTTPAADRTDTVYLDTWEEEIAGSDGGDTRLIDDRLGVETAVRVKREWAVRVQENASDLSTIVREDGHSYLPLARLNRRKNVAAIAADMIVDQRKTGITLTEHIKVPLFLQMGLEILDLARFIQMLNGLRTSLFARLRGGQLPHQTASAQDENILLMALQEAMNRAHIGEVQAASRNMDNRDALDFMLSLYTAQKDFLNVLQAIGNVGNTAQNFITDYLKYLDGSSADFIKGVKLALDNQDLLAAVIAQEELNSFLSAPITNLPEGSVNVFYQTVVPFEPLAAGSTYDFTFEVESQVTSPLGNENFNIQVALSAASWTAVVDQPQVTLANLGGTTTITVTVTPNAAETQATLTITAIAARNPLIRSPQPGVDLEIGVEPPVGSFFFYADSRLNAQNQLEIRQNHLTRVTGRDILFKIKNDNASEIRTYHVVHFISPNVADTTGWSPLQASPATQDVQVNPNTTTDYFARVDGPKSPAPAPPIGTTGEIVATATLIEIDGTPVADGATQEVRIDFIVIA
jgi:hypothetical protein